MSFFNKINNNTIVDTLKQLRNRRDCKIFCTEPTHSTKTDHSCNGKYKKMSNFKA